jgi:hypothetical protein
MATRGRRSAGDRSRDRRVRDILQQCRKGKIQLVRFLYCSDDGVIRGKSCHVEFLESYLESGIGLTVAMQSFNMLDQLVPEGSFGLGHHRLKVLFLADGSRGETLGFLAAQEDREA